MSLVAGINHRNVQRAVDATPKRNSAGTTDIAEDENLRRVNRQFSHAERGHLSVT